MAQTLPNGTIVPNADGGEAISETGVQEMRTLGASVDTAIAEARYTRGRIVTEVDAFTLGAGVYTISSVQYAGMVENLPEVYPGILTIEGNPDVNPIRTIRFTPYMKDYVWETVSNDLADGFTPWRKVGSAGGGAYAANAVNQARMVHHYGPVDTGGLGAVAWRIDHGLKNFRDIMLPIFKAAGIVPMITLNPRDWSRAENEGVTYSEVNGWVSRGEVEISNHGATHANAEGDEEIEAFVADGLAELESQLPSAEGKIFGFHIPGVGVSEAFGGFQGGDTPERWDTTMGRAILKHHAFGSGHIPGTDLRVLDGTIRQGLLHMSTDARAGTEITAKIDEAIATRRGFQIMTHPSSIGSAGRQTAADIQAIVNHIVAKRDAGELAVLSPYQMMVADSTNPPVTIPDVTDLAARLDAIEYKSGPRDITSRMSVQPVSGRLYAERIGDVVWCDMSGIRMPASAGFVQLVDLFPVGFRPRRIQDFATAKRNKTDPAGGLRVDYSGTAYFYVVDSSRDIRGVVSWPTRDAPPSNLPGTPA